MMIKAVMLDWAGTTVDYGCFAPVEAFRECFRKRGIEVADEEIRKPMGLLKIDHIRAMCNMGGVRNRWMETTGRLPDEDDIRSLYEDFEPMLFSILRDHCEPIPGAIELAARLRERKIKIGSTTGYTSGMMKIVQEEAERRGYRPDHLVTPDEVRGGRPHPWMIYRNAEELGIYPMSQIVKCGDTISDIREGVNAGVWTVGVVEGSSELGLSLAEVESADPASLRKQSEEVARRFKEAGAHFVIRAIGELDAAVADIEKDLLRGHRP